MLRLFKMLSDWADDLGTIRDISNSDLARTYFWPFATTALTAATGYFGKAPIMWVIMASALTLMAVVNIMVNLILLKERTNPQNKLLFQIVYQNDISPYKGPSPDVIQPSGRRALPQKAMELTLTPMQLHPQINRSIQRSQLGIEVTNGATFPISCILAEAQTDLMGNKPPRSKFPRQPTVIPTGSKVRILDDRIDMQGLDCQKLSGRIDLLVKYGRPAREIYELRVCGAVEVYMEPSGLVTGIMFSPDTILSGTVATS